MYSSTNRRKSQTPTDLLVTLHCLRIVADYNKDANIDELTKMVADTNKVIMVTILCENNNRLTLEGVGRLQDIRHCAIKLQGSFLKEKS